MKEFTFTFEKGLKKGLRKHHDNPRNNEALVTCLNVKSSESGLIPIVPVTYSAVSPPTFSWPYPLMFQCEDGTVVLADATTIYEVNISTWVLTSKLSSLTAGTVWDFASFGSYIYGTNGSVQVKRTAAGAWTSFASETNIPRVSTLCSFKGQFIGGNVKTTWHSRSTNSLIWSEIGAINCTPSLLNTAGFRDIPWPGDVQRVRRLGDGIAMYGDQGIGFMIPVSEPAPTFGFKELLGVGIVAKGAIGGDRHVHAFVDEEYWLWLWEEGQAPRRLGYQEFMSNLTGANIVIAYDPGDQEFYISDGSTSYLLTRYGLCETYQRVTSVIRIGDTTHGPFSSGSDTSFTLWTDTMDFGSRGFKTLGHIELGVDTGEVNQDVQIAVSTRADKTGALSTSSWINTNPEGIGFSGRTAHEFRVGVKAAAYGGMKLDYINLHVKVVDRRAIRGVYPQRVT